MKLIILSPPSVALFLFHSGILTREVQRMGFKAVRQRKAHHPRPWFSKPLNLFCVLGYAESQAVLALPAESWPIRGCGGIHLQRLAPQTLHAQRNLPDHVPAGR